MTKCQYGWSFPSVKGTLLKEPSQFKEKQGPAAEITGLNLVSLIWAGVSNKIAFGPHISTMVRCFTETGGHIKMHWRLSLF